MGVSVRELEKDVTKIKDIKAGVNDGKDVIVGITKEEPTLGVRTRSQMTAKPKAEVVAGCFKCGKSRCQVCSFILEGSSFRCSTSGKEYPISDRFDCDSLGVVYLLGCKVCGKQYVGSTKAAFRNRFNSYKSYSRTFSKGRSVDQAQLYEHFTEANHHGFLEDVTVQIIDTISKSRETEREWQEELDSVGSKKLNVRFACKK